MERDLIDLAEARRRVLDATSPLPPEDVPLEEALDRVLAEDLASTEDLPPFDSSAMDGFAVVAGPGGDLRVVGESRAGHPSPRALGPGEAMVISTGAQIPAGADAVVPVERAEVGEGSVGVPATRPGDHVRRAGEDTRPGELLLRAGAGLGPAEVAVLAALGRPEARCGRRPRVAVLVTGDELVTPAAARGPGQIRDSNLYALSAQSARAGGQVVSREVAPDDPGAIDAALSRGLDRADVVCVSGGVSVGPHDHVKPALERLGVREVFWGVSLKPGKPTWFGHREGALVFGLPGNPVSAMVTFQLLARPAIRALQGASAEDSRASAVLDRDIARDPRREQAVRCRLERHAEELHATPAGAQGSHVLTSMLGAGALALVPAGEGSAQQGGRVEVELLW